MKTGFVLSGGGARGFAHIGAVKALQERKIPCDMISGTSAGAMIGVFLADGFAPGEIQEIFREHELPGIFNFISWSTGLSLDRVKKMLETTLRSKTFEQLTMPFYVTATDYNSGEKKVFSSGELIAPIIASASIPVLFPPVYINNVPYVDGGISSNLPAASLEGKADRIVGVHVNPPYTYNEKAGIAERTDRAMHMGLRPNIRADIARCNLFIEPPGLSKFHLFDSKKIDAIVSEGYDYTKDFLDKNGMF